MRTLDTTTIGDKPAISELTQQRWAVISERSVEASGMTYDDALTLLRHLSKDKTHGLCIVTDEAAKRDAKVPPLTSGRT